MALLTAMRMKYTANMLRTMRPDQLFFYDLEVAPPIEFKHVPGAGLDPYHAMIAEIGVIRGDGEIFERKLIERRTPPGVYRNLRSLDIKQYRKDLKYSMSDFLRFCGGNSPERKFAMIAHNGNNFDQLYIGENLEQCGHIQPKNWVHFDTYRWSQLLFNGNHYHSLKALSKKYEVPYINAHTALGDSVILMEVFDHMMRDSDRSNN